MSIKELTISPLIKINQKTANNDTPNLITMHNAKKPAKASIIGYLADIFSLHNRGRIMPGCYADMVLLDIDTILNSTNVANFANPHIPPEGTVNVWVNGKLSYDYYQQKIRSCSGVIL